ncbi:MAG: CRTAC1 family protein [Planctomycetota bacterium]
MIASLVLFALPPLQVPAIRVLAEGDGGFREVALVTADAPGPVLLPLVSRSERVQRAPSREGLRLRVEGIGLRGGPRVSAVSHAADHQVLLFDGVAMLVGPPTLPHAARAQVSGAEVDDGVDVLPELARQDGIAPPAWTELRCDRPGGADPELRLIALGAEQPRTAWLGADERLAAGDAIDQAFYATVAPLTDTLRREPVGAEHQTGVTEVEFAALPEADSGHTWTWILEFDRGELEEPARPLPAAAPAAPAEGFLRDRAAELGVSMVHFEGPDEQLDIRPTMGPGAAWGDYDLDGAVDLYLVQGGGRRGSEAPANRLLRQEAGRFSDVTASAGGGDTGAGMGALFFDADGDGDLDLFVANYGADVLYDNRLPAALADVSDGAGIGGDLWSAGVAASDYDRDGDLDLYVTSYLVYDTSLMPPTGELGSYRREDPIEMLPFAFPGQRNTFLRNESNAEELRFADATEDLKLTDEAGRGMQPVFWDFDRDGDDDLYVANDVSYNMLWRNEDGARFKDVSFATGMDDPRGGMGVAVGDVDQDGDEDLFLTNWQLEPNALYLNNLLSHRSKKHRVATFRDAIVPSGLGPSGIGATSWGAELFDAENDGDLDLFVANGYTSPDYESTGICVGQPNHFFENDGRGGFVEASAGAGRALARELPSRCAVGCDFDRDGDVDLVVTANNGPVQLLRNELPQERRGHWLLIRLRGAGANTHAIGAEVTLTAGERTQRRSLRAGTSYLGGNPPELHFGLGEAATGEVSVRWPSGAESRHAIEAVDRVVVLGEPR